jgi:putative spermidine/putrescine transport system ATP-binding protein
VRRSGQDLHAGADVPYADRYKGTMNVAAEEADIVLDGVRKTFGDVSAVAGVDLRIARGEFFTMLGPSGSGKTTCLRMIAGFERPDAGRIELAGREVTALPPQERDVNTVFQDYALFPHLSVGDNVGYGLRVRKVAAKERGERVAEALALVRLEGLGDRRPAELSGGQRQRVALARALVNRPRVLLLDEPLGALDLKLRQELQVELKRIQQEVGITFVYVTHDQDEALSMSDRIAVMDAGRIVQIGTPREVYDEPASRFVAGFVGVSNLLELPVAGADGDRTQLSLGPEDRVSVAGTVPGEVAVVTVRPERIQLLAAGTPPEDEDCIAAGTLRESLFAGPTTRAIVDLDGGGSLVVVRPNDHRASEYGEPAGSRVLLTWPRGATRLVEERTSQAEEEQ